MTLGARFDNNKHDDDIQPEVYKAPEVILHMKWSYKVDIWNLGAMVAISAVANMKIH